MSAPLFQQWLDFAKEDLAVAQLTFDEKHFSHACFLSQQAIEKALKAFLIAKLNQYPRIHNLTDLLTQCINLDANFTQFVTECATVDQYYIPTRYPSGIPVGQLQRHLPINMRKQQLMQLRESCNLSLLRLHQIPHPAHKLSLTLSFA